MDKIYSESTGKSLTKSERLARILRETIAYCYFDLSEEERALLTLQIKTTNKTDLDGIEAMLNDDLSEVVAREMFVTLLIRERRRMIAFDAMMNGFNESGSE